jgi:hypothetical protein
MFCDSETATRALRPKITAKCLKPSSGHAYRQQVNPHSNDDSRILCPSTLGTLAAEAEAVDILIPMAMTKLETLWWKSMTEHRRPPL